MRVKRYVADTVSEAIAQVKQDLGRNAIILHTKPFNEGGFMGLFSKRRVEVIAAVDEEQGSSELIRMKRAEPLRPGFTPLTQAMEAIAEHQEAVPLASRSFRSSEPKLAETSIATIERVPSPTISKVLEAYSEARLPEARSLTPLVTPRVEISQVNSLRNEYETKSATIPVLNQVPVKPIQASSSLRGTGVIGDFIPKPAETVVLKSQGTGVIESIRPKRVEEQSSYVATGVSRPSGTGVIERILPRTESLAERQVEARETEALWNELAEMKKMLQQVTTKTTVDEVEQQRQKWFNYLKNLGLETELIEDLLARTRGEDLSTAELRSSKLMEDWTQVLGERLICNDPFPANLAGQQVLALIGPTGVGKTTTIAKLAANFHLFEGKKVGLVTIDTYRIAAVEHLKTYGDIINLPVEVVYSPTDLPLALQKLQNCELILVDTAGRSPYNRPMMDELQKFFNQGLISTIMLAISATTKYADMLNIVEKFTKVPYTHLIFTKLDETSCLGPLVSLAWKTRQPISYFTIGQNVPDDIEIAKPQQLITRLFKGNVDD